MYDLGGGTFDVSILEIAGGVIEVKATNGDTHLGGEDFDLAVSDWILDEFRKTSGIDLTKDRKALQRIREAAEKAKCELSSAMQTEINLPFISANAEGPQYVQLTLTRLKFESLTKKLIDRSVTYCKRCVKEATVELKDLDEVVLIGGMTRMPKVIEAVKSFFGKEPLRGVNPEEAVALGAATMTGVLCGEIPGRVLRDVMPLSLGIETLGGVFTCMFPKNTTIPTKKSQVYSTAADNQTQVVSIKVFQGEREMAADNHMIGQFDLVGIPPRPRGVPQIEVTFDIDVHGICLVTAKDKATGETQNITVVVKSGLSKAYIERMIKDSEVHAEADRVKRELVDVKNNAETQCHTAENQLTDWKYANDAEKANIRTLLQELRTAMENRNATKDNLAGATDRLQKAIMECGLTEYQQTAAANSNSGASNNNQQPGEQQQLLLEGEEKQYE